MRIVQKLKQEGKITDREIEEAKFNRNEKRRMEVVLQGLRNGLSYPETAQSDETLELSEQQYVTSKKKLLESGAITEEEILLAREKRKVERAQEIRENYEAPQDNQIFTLCMLGFNLEQMSQILGVRESYISRRRSELCNKHKISKNRISELVKNRQSNAEKRRNSIYAMATLDKKVNHGTVQAQIEYTKASMTLGIVERSDIKSIVAILPVYPEFITPGTVNVVIRYLIREKSENIALKFIRECKLALEPTDERFGKLIEADKLILEHIAKRKQRRRVKPVGHGGNEEQSL